MCNFIAFNWLRSPHISYVRNGTGSVTERFCMHTQHFFLEAFKSISNSKYLQPIDVFLLLFWIRYLPVWLKLQTAPQLPVVEASILISVVGCPTSSKKQSWNWQFTSLTASQLPQIDEQWFQNFHNFSWELLILVYQNIYSREVHTWWQQRQQLVCLWPVLASWFLSRFFLVRERHAFLILLCFPYNKVTVTASEFSMKPKYMISFVGSKADLSLCVTNPSLWKICTVVSAFCLVYILHRSDLVGNIHLWRWLRESAVLWNEYITIVNTITYPLTARVIGAPQMTPQPVSSIFSVLHHLLGLGKLQACPFHDVFPPLFFCLPCLLHQQMKMMMSSSFLSLCLARWFWPDLMNGRHVHTTSVCVSLWWPGGLCVV